MLALGAVGDVPVGDGPQATTIPTPPIIPGAQYYSPTFWSQLYWATNYWPSGPFAAVIVIIPGGNYWPQDYSAHSYWSAAYWPAGPKSVNPPPPALGANYWPAYWAHNYFAPSYWPGPKVGVGHGHGGFRGAGRHLVMQALIEEEQNRSVLEEVTRQAHANLKERVAKNLAEYAKHKRLQKRQVEASIYTVLLSEV